MTVREVQDNMEEDKSVTETKDGAFEQMLKEFRPLFWDTDIDALDMTANGQYVISRLLSMGGMPDYLWVTRHYSEKDIVEAIWIRIPVM